MLCIVDYNTGNVGSILNMCKRAGISAVSASDIGTVRSSTHLLIPGVGAFDNGIKNLRESGLDTILAEEVLSKQKPVLGVCLGAQIMLESSSEGNEKGLGWIKGRCEKFESGNNIKVPHMGWNSLTIRCNDGIFNEMPANPPRFYFVHSYYFSLEKEENIIATTQYGIEFSSAFKNSNIYGVQFHPEKSHMFGLQLLLNFMRI